MTDCSAQWADRLQSRVRHGQGGDPLLEQAGLAPQMHSKVKHDPVWQVLAQF